MYQTLREGKIHVFLRKNLKSSDFYYVEPGFYSSIMNFVEAMNIFLPELHNHSEMCSTVKLSRGTQKVEIYLANEGSGFKFLKTDFRYIFGSKVGKELGVMLRRKRPQKPKVLHDIVRVH